MKLIGLTGLRGIAALVVVIYHLSQYRSIDSLGRFSWDMYLFLEHFVFVVSLFFLFSGFFRALSYWKYYGFETGGPRFFSSLRSRLIRIMPLYYIILTATFFIMVLGGGDVIDIIRYLSGVFFVSWVSPITFFPVDINGPLWFVSFDLIGWIFISTLMSLVIRYPQIHLTVLMFLTTGCILLLLHFFWISLPWIETPGIAGEWFPQYNPFLFSLHFLFGAAIAGGVEYLRRRQMQTHFSADILGILSIFMLLLFLWNIRESGDWEYSWPEGPYHFPITIVFLGFLVGSLPFSRFLGIAIDNALFLFLGRISYALYLSHVLVLVGLRVSIFKNVELGFNNWLLFALISLIISIFVAWILTEYVEKKIVDRLESS